MKPCALCGRETELVVCRHCRDNDPDIQKAIEQAREEDERAYVRVTPDVLPEPGSAVAPPTDKEQDLAVMVGDDLMPHVGTGKFISSKPVASEAPRVDLEAIRKRDRLTVVPQWLIHPAEQDRRALLEEVDRLTAEHAATIDAALEFQKVCHQLGFEKGLQRAAELCESGEVAWFAADKASLIGLIKHLIRAELEKGGGT